MRHFNLFVKDTITEAFDADLQILKERNSSQYRFVYMDKSWKYIIYRSKKLIATTRGCVILFTADNLDIIDFDPGGRIMLPRTRESKGIVQLHPDVKDVLNGLNAKYGDAHKLDDSTCLVHYKSLSFIGIVLYFRPTRELEKTYLRFNKVGEEMRCLKLGRSLNNLDNLMIFGQASKVYAYFIFPNSDLFDLSKGHGAIIFTYGVTNIVSLYVTHLFSTFFATLFRFTSAHNFMLFATLVLADAFNGKAPSERELELTERKNQFVLFAISLGPIEDAYMGLCLYGLVGELLDEGISSWRPKWDACQNGTFWVHFQPLMRHVKRIKCGAKDSNFYLSGM